MARVSDFGWPSYWLGFGSEHVATQLGEIALPGPQCEADASHLS